MSLLRTLDPGTMGGDDGGFVVPGLMLLVTLGGILVVSSLIGVLTTGSEQPDRRASKGRSPVLGKGHAVILGWSDQVFIVVSELAKANAGRPVDRGRSWPTWTRWPWRTRSRPGWGTPDGCG
jgi:hypothetical protein